MGPRAGRPVIDAAVITASDRSARGERADASGPALAALLARIPARLAGLRVVPDTVRDIRGALRSFLRDPALRLILTTGGTGVTPRDVTPEATAPLIERALPGLALALRWESYGKTPFALVSRALAGFHGDCLIVNLPGSPRAVDECFAILLPTLRQLFGGNMAPGPPAGGGGGRGARASRRRKRWH
ncbi:MAG TPA: MogA/MoaB family molybdenum cofactor biosynthesis protein [Candidatus Methanoperedens sp.]|nr:MogA/MoaB family molybdenum cofactor biosynthesis protein [Candidatus Methanoperedens sp.]